MAIIEVFVIFRCDVYVEIFHACLLRELFEDVTSISYLFIIFAWFITLIEIGRYTFRGAFHCNIGLQSVFYAEVLGIILAIEYAAREGWRNIWLKSDSTSALLIFSKSILVPIMLRNRWHNARQLGIQVISSHTFREGNCCADKLALMGHFCVGAVWLNTLPSNLSLDFFRDRRGLPNYRFPEIFF